MGTVSISNINEMQSMLDCLDRSNSDNLAKLSEKEETLKELEKYWTSETEDEATYFSNSYNNIEKLRQVISASERLVEVLRDYVSRTIKESNN